MLIPRDSYISLLRVYYIAPSVLEFALHSLLDAVHALLSLSLFRAVQLILAITARFRWSGTLLQSQVCGRGQGAVVSLQASERCVICVKEEALIEVSFLSLKERGSAKHCTMKEGAVGSFEFVDEGTLHSN